MISILRALYDGDIEVCSHGFPPDPGYKKALQESSDLKDELKSRFSKEDYATLEKLFDIQAQAYSYEVFNYFKDGFSTGMMLMYEVLDDLHAKRRD